VVSINPTPREMNKYRPEHLYPAASTTASTSAGAILDGVGDPDPGFHVVEYELPAPPSVSVEIES
jgi:hypothetical protein